MYEIKEINGRYILATCYLGVWRDPDGDESLVLSMLAKRTRHSYHDAKHARRALKALRQ